MIINKIKYIFIIAYLVVSSYVQAQVAAPGKEQRIPIALVGGIAHLGNGEVINNSIITFDKGKLTHVVDALTSKLDLKGYEVHYIEGKHVYPGFILPDTDLGLVEIASVRATVDNNEVGDYNPHIRSLIAYNTDSEITPTFKYNGILYAQVTPIGGIISGSSSVVSLDAWNWEDAVLREDDGIHLNWPQRYIKSGWWAEPGPTKSNDKYENTIKEIQSFFEDAAAYHKVFKPNVVNLKMKAMKGLFDGSKTLYIHVDYAKDIIESVKMARAYGVQKIVLIGAEDVYLVKDFVKSNNIPVLLSNLHRLPNRPEEDVDLPYKLPLILQQEGILVGLTYTTRMTPNSRNLPFYAGTAAAHGLDKEEALKTITSNTATILGIADKAGTLEAGKLATLFVSTGDALDMKSSNLEMAFVDGRRVTLENKQQVLYKKFKEKYDGDDERPVQMIAEE